MYTCAGRTRARDRPEDMQMHGYAQGAAHRYCTKDLVLLKLLRQLLPQVEHMLCRIYVALPHPARRKAS
jgi:hypothetical protein